MAHNGQHATCPKCGTDLPFDISGNLAVHDPTGALRKGFDGYCAGSGMTERQISKAVKENQS